MRPYGSRLSSNGPSNNQIRGEILINSRIRSRETSFGEGGRGWVLDVSHLEKERPNYTYLSASGARRHAPRGRPVRVSRACRPLKHLSPQISRPPAKRETGAPRRARDDGHRIDGAQGRGAPGRGGEIRQLGRLPPLPPPPLTPLPAHTQHAGRRPNLFVSSLDSRASAPASRARSTLRGQIRQSSSRPQAASGAQRPPASRVGGVAGGSSFEFRRRV